MIHTWIEYKTIKSSKAVYILSYVTDQAVREEIENIQRKWYCIYVNNCSHIYFYIEQDFGDGGNGWKKNIYSETFQEQMILDKLVSPDK